MKTKETMKSEVSTVPQWLKGFCRYDVEIFYEHIPKGIYISIRLFLNSRVKGTAQKPCASL